MGGLSTVTGGIAVVLMLVGSNLLRRFSWKVCAMITPAVLISEFWCFWRDLLQQHAASEGSSIVQAISDGVIDRELIVFAVILGLAVNAFGKAVKYSLFDPTKKWPIFL